MTEHFYEAIEGTAWAAVEKSNSLVAGQFVTLANWQEEPHHQWAFQHMRELMPSQVIDGNDEPRGLPEAHVELGAIEVPGREVSSTVDGVLAATETDGFLVMHRGRVVAERYYGTLTRRRRHLVMSVSKSIVSCVAAGLFADGLLDPEAPVERYVPELVSSGYSGATVRDVLDMRTGIRFNETYLDPQSEVRVMERSMGWAPRNHDDPLGMYPYILSIGSETEHGGTFVYRSIDTDTLGWILERAAGERMADLISRHVWVPIGAFHDAEITADPLGSAIHDGGVSATLRDLARFGWMLLDRGRVGSQSVLPQSWFDDVLNPPADVRQAFANSENEPYLPGGWYRSQFWCIPGDGGAAADPIMMCLGIHGQMVFVQPSKHLVGVKLSTWPYPQDSAKLSATIAMFAAIGRHLDS